MDIVIAISLFVFLIALSAICGLLGIGVDEVETEALAESSNTIDVIGNSVEFFINAMSFKIQGAEWLSSIMTVIIVVIIGLLLMRFLRGQ